MTRSSQILRNLSIALLVAFLSQACMQVKSESTPTPPSAEERGVTPAPLPTATTTPLPLPTQTEAAPAASPIPNVTLNVVKGNLFIRRGPDMAFNPIGVLYKDTRAKVIARDVLSDWAQIEIPNSDKTGWVSVQTEFSQIEGGLKDLPEFKITEWPVAAYLRNCTHHRMYVVQSEVVIPSSFEFPDNEIWIYPGTYTILDIDVPDDPEVATITVQEGSDIEIREDGLGEKRKCP